MPDQNTSEVVRVLSLLQPLLTFLGGFLTALLAEPARQRLFRPKVVLEFGNREDCVTKTPEGLGDSQHEACYLRVKVSNSSKRLAKSCRAYLVNVERQGPNGLFHPSLYCESLQLSWSCMADQAFVALDIPGGASQYVDVVSTRSVATGFAPSLRLIPFRYANSFHEPGTYRFTILVAGDGVRPVSLKILFNWRSRWDNFDASSE